MKKILFCVFIFLLTFSLSGCNTKSYSNSDFKLEIKVETNEVTVNDDIIVSVLLYNLTSNDIKIFLGHTLDETLQTSIKVGLFNIDEAVSFFEFDIKGPLKKDILKSKEIIYLEKEFKLDKIKQYKIAARVKFFINNKEKEQIYLTSNEIIIDVKKEENINLCNICNKCNLDGCYHESHEYCKCNYEHTHILCEECNKCLDYNCTGDKCLGHKVEDTHAICDICERCVEENCQEQSHEKCEGHNEHIHNLCTTCNKCKDENCLDDKCNCFDDESNHKKCEMCGLCSIVLCEEKNHEKCKGHYIEYSHQNCPICYLCIDENCLENDQKCEGHTLEHEHSKCYECGKCTYDCELEENQKCEGHAPFIFFPSEPSDYNSDVLIELVRKRYENKNDFYTYNLSEIKNYMPIDIAKKYDIDAFRVLVERKISSNNLIKEYEYYVRVKDTIFRVDHIGAACDANFSGFIHFALYDVNKDGYFEIYVSYHLHNNLVITYYSIIDTKILKIWDKGRVYDDYVFYKTNENSELSLYISKTNDIEQANEYLCTIYPNKSKYNFNALVYNISTQNYDVKVEVFEDELDFAVSKHLLYTIKTTLTWKGDTFSYLNHNTHLDGAYPILVKDGETMYTPPIGGGDAMTRFEIYTGKQIVGSYGFYSHGSEDIEKQGSYDLEISYSFSFIKIKIKNFLNVSVEE